MTPTIGHMKYLQESTNRYTKNKIYPCAKLGIYYVMMNEEGGVSTFKGLRSMWWTEVRLTNAVGGTLI